MVASEFVGVGVRMAGVALILGALGAAVTGLAFSIGESIRTVLLGPLQSVRDNSPMARDDLADMTVVAAAMCAFLSVALDGAWLAVLIGVMLFVARPMVKRAMRVEDPMQAIGGQFGTDFVMGIYAPVALAQLLLGNVYLAMSMSLVLVALAWPPGGAGVSSKRGEPGPVVPALVN